MSESAEQARTRRRWISLAEFVAVAGLLIGALTLWSNWSDRRADEASKAAEQAGAAREKARIELTASVEDDGKQLALKDERHDIADARVVFPTALSIGSQNPAGDPVIEAAWFEKQVLKMTDGGPDDRTGRLPVLLTLRYWDDDVERSATGIYDVIWSTHGRRLFGRALKVEGLKLRQRGGDQAALDKAWARLKP